MRTEEKTPEILVPSRETLPVRTRPGSFLSDENLDRFTHLLDDRFRIPGIPLRFGIDGIIGLIPGIGDFAGGLLSCITVVAAWMRGVPYVTLVRMLVNIAIEVIIGTVPLIGDIFDIAWKANRRNYALLIRHVEQPRRHTWRDWIFLCTITAIFLAVLLVPVLLLVWAANYLTYGR